MKHVLARNCIAVLCLLFFPGLLEAQTLAGSKLVAALQQGGLVIVMRHTSSPRVAPDSVTVNTDNVNAERQLDEKGRRDAALFGEALRRLQVPLGEVRSSPAYRALETARLAGLDDATVQEELGNEGMSDSTEQYAEWLRKQVADQPRMGIRLLITHGPNINAAFPGESAGMEEGDALVFDPEGSTGPILVARIKCADWAAL